ncbi:MAG TPA: hypothetical protein PKA95_18975 [Thermomicrobiales bacterium]|nr:hypothetical protein [Thermomicrobiales bacterium]
MQRDDAQQELKARLAMGFIILALGFGVGIITGALIDRKLGRGHLGERHSIGSHISESEAISRHMY